MTRSIPATTACSILCVLFSAALSGCGGSTNARTDGAVLTGGSTIGSGGVVGSGGVAGGGTGGTKSTGGTTATGGMPSSGGLTGAGGGNTTTGGTNGTGGSSGHGGSQGGTGGTANDKTGVVMIYQMAGNQYGAPYAYYRASASFSDTPNTTPGCTTTNVDPCTITVCDTTLQGGGADAGDGGTLPPPNAGKITITGGLHSIDLTVDVTTHDYPSVSDTTSLFHAGDTLTYQAAGGDVPQFQDTVTAPESIVLSAPPIPLGIVMNFALDNPPQFVWSNGGASKVRITLFQPSTSISQQVLCEYDASSGVASIPVAALAGLGKGQQIATLSVYTKATKNITAGNYSVSLAAATMANDTGQNIASVQVNLL